LSDLKNGKHCRVKYPELNCEMWHPPVKQLFHPLVCILRHTLEKGMFKPVLQRILHEDILLFVKPEAVLVTPLSRCNRILRHACAMKA
jgi:hypothetical protein